MAKQENKKDSNKPKGNIRLEIAIAQAGLNLDSSISQVGPGRLTYALNAAVENFDSSSVNYQNEPGNELCLDFPDGYKLIGSHFIPEKRKNIFFLANPGTGGSEIGYMDNNDCQYRTLVNAPCLNFDVKNPIPKVVHRITNCTTELYWTDGVNPRRYLDIENVPYKLIAGTPSCDPVYGDELDCNQLKLQPDFSIPQLMITQVRNIGNLTAGTYQFAVQYADASGNELTSYYSVTNPTPIADEFKTTVNFNYEVGKSIVVGVSNLDLTGQFEYFNLAVIKTINNTSSVELIGTYNIEEPTKEITYTGGDETAIRLSISDIFEKFPYYDIAQDVTAVQDVLVWDNLTSIDRINYQSIANQITLGWETHRIPADENYADEINATNLRGYMRDEVYAFEIVFLLKNGKQTDGFHIPGRERNANEAFPDVPDTNSDFIGDPDYFTGTTGYQPYWKIYNTASVTGNSPGYSTDVNYKGPYQHGEFAYWESTEEYPCEEDVWGDLAGQPIRHHKFPDVLVSPIIENGQIVYQNDKIVPAMQNDAVFPIGVKLDNSQVSSLIQNSGLTQDQKDDIVAYKIIRADRGTNKSVIAKGILRNVNKYTRDEEDYYYPNYPYNDLSEDPYVLANNNAWSAESEPWLIHLPENTTIELPGKDLEITVNEGEGVFEYTSALNGKVTQAIIQPDETIEICSLTRPIPLLGKMTIGPGNYDVYKADHGDTWIDLPFGYRLNWHDPFQYPGELFTGTTQFRQTWLSDDPFGSDGRGTVIVEMGAPAPYSSGCESLGWPINQDLCTPEIRFKDPADEARGEVASTSGIPQAGYIYGTGSRFSSRRSTLGCKEEKPQTPIEEIDPEERITDRQIFNSPETSFGQPFLGSVLKLESVMFGAGKAHWVKVKDNANYKLLSKEAQLDALDASKEIANLGGFNAGAMFTAYQAYLTIYINGITRKNYAMSFNSRANYDYSYPIDNDLGIKQRDIDLTRYLIPGVQSLGGDELSINNWNRETSVFIRTSQEREYNGQSIDSVLFPSQTPSLLNGATPYIEDESRFTIGNKGACPTPEKEQDLTVVSYYASMKNIFPNQYGQIYSYQTIDTGFQALVGRSGTSTVFGGDTFISRFAFKTKLPFFIDNRVGAPDDSDVFYDEIGNVGYPAYWHSARSILEDYTPPGTTIPMRNLISYKAHNFDCPNDPSSIPVGGGSFRTFYDGYFYLFAYGIPNFYCESTYNTDLRQAFNNKEGDFWPHVSSGIPDDWLQETNVPIAQDNTYYYNVTYSKQNKENVFSHLPPDWQDDLCYTVFPFRAIYSDAAITSADSRVNNWLVYRALSFHDFPQNYGNLTSLDGIQNKAILARFENKSLLYNNLLTIDTSNPQAAYIGNPRLFDSSPPIDFAETDLGYVGSQNKFLLKIPQGQITVDAKRGQVFLVSGTRVLDLTAFGSGVNRFMSDHLPFEILQYFPNVPTDNHFNGIGLHGVYDSKFERVIITKLDYIPLRDDIQYDEETGDFFIYKRTQEIPGPTPPEPVIIPTPTDPLPIPTNTSGCKQYTTLPFPSIPGDIISITYIDCDGNQQAYFEECTKRGCSATICAIEIIDSNRELDSTGVCSVFSPTTTTTTTRIVEPPKDIIYLTDEEYFCNKSWTISFDFNTKSWISFHTYIPNFYIGENNFFYSGINGCCTTIDGFDVVAGKLLPFSLTTTTTTTARTPLFPPTTITTTTIDDVLQGGFFIPTDCSLAGTGVITVPPATTTTTCYVPSTNLDFVTLVEGYQIIGDSAVTTTDSEYSSCNGIAVLKNGYIGTTTPSVLPININLYYEGSGLQIGTKLYVSGQSEPCPTVPDGWYGILNDTNNVYNISYGFIEEIKDCGFCLTTSTTTTQVPSVEECCGIIALTTDNVYSGYVGNNSNPESQTSILNVPGFVGSATAGVAWTSSKLWTIDTDIKEWDITLLPFTATFNRNITYGETPSVAGNIAISNTLLLGVDASNSPQQIIEIDVTTATAVKTSQFAIQANRTVISNLLYTTTNKLLLVSQDSLSSNYYVTQFNYSNGSVELDINIGTVDANIITGSECGIRLTKVDGSGNVEVYIVYPTGISKIIDSTAIPPDVGPQTFPLYTTVSQLSSYVNCAIENTTTTTTSSSTTTTTTTLSPTCNEYEVSGPTALYYTDCFGQQEIVSIGSGQTENVCASVAIPGATLIGPCPDYTTTTTTTTAISP